MIELAVQERQPALNIQIWKAYTDVMDITLIDPSGLRAGPIPEVLGSQRFLAGDTEILLYYGEPSPYSMAQEIYIDLLPAGDYIRGGVWRIVLSPRRVLSGQYELWLPGESVLNRGTGFSLSHGREDHYHSATAGRVVSVGAYNSRTLAYADFSGRGYVREGEAPSRIWQRRG